MAWLITPNRVASEAKHFRYGEKQGTPLNDTKDSFATYRRDGTGLDCAWDRYYSPTMGKFTMADSYGGANPGDPQTWNRNRYTWNDPIIVFDPDGALAQRLVSDAMTALPTIMFFPTRAMQNFPPEAEFSGFDPQDHFLS